MITVKNLSWQNFKMVELQSGSVKELAQLATQGEDGFVFYDQKAQLPALLHPKQVLRIIDESGLWEEDATVQESGLLDLIRRGQMLVKPSQPATRIAWMAEKYEMPVVITVGSYNRPKGLFIPSVALERIPDGFLFQEKTSPELREEFTQLSRAGRFAAAIELLSNEHDEFHAEPINIMAPDPYFCEGGGGHYASCCPCGDTSHASNNCRRNQVNGNPRFI